MCRTDQAFDFPSSEYRDSNALLGVARIKRLVATLESGDPIVYERLDEQGTILVLQILLNSEPCLAQQRGFFLLSVGASPYI